MKLSIVALVLDFDFDLNCINFCLISLLLATSSSSSFSPARGLIERINLVCFVERHTLRTLLPLLPTLLSIGELIFVVWVVDLVANCSTKLEQANVPISVDFCCSLSSPSLITVSTTRKLALLLAFVDSIGQRLFRLRILSLLNKCDSLCLSLFLVHYELTNKQAPHKSMVTE